MSKSANADVDVNTVHANVRRAFDLKEPNSIAQQVRRLISDACVAHAWFQAITSQPSHDNWYGVNPIFYEATSRWYRASQSLAIRKLVDGCKKRLDGQKLRGPDDPEHKLGVYSLGHMVWYLHRHREKITRDAMQRLMGVRTPEATDWESHKPVLGQPTGLRSVSSAPFTYELFHQQFDWLCGNHRTRSSDDCLSAVPLLKIAGSLARVEKEVSNYVNKFVAHAASRTSREEVTSAPSGAQLHSARRVVCRAYWWLELHLVRYVDVEVLEPTPFDGLDNLSNPLLPPLVHDLAIKEWERYSRKVRSWRRCYVRNE